MYTQMSTHVISAALIAWKKAAMIVRRLLKYDPNRVHRASKPVKSAMVPKKRAINMKANINRVMR
jgi:hypothetical protein